MKTLTSLTVPLSLSLSLSLSAGLAMARCAAREKPFMTQ